MPKATPYVRARSSVLKGEVVFGVGVYDELAACGVVVVVVGGGRAHAHLWYGSSPNVGMQ